MCTDAGDFGGSVEQRLFHDAFIMNSLYRKDQHSNAFQFLTKHLETCNTLCLIFDTNGHWVTEASNLLHHFWELFYIVSSKNRSLMSFMSSNFLH